MLIISSVCGSWLVARRPRLRLRLWISLCEFFIAPINLWLHFSPSFYISISLLYYHKPLCFILARVCFTFIYTHCSWYAQMFLSAVWVNFVITHPLLKHEILNLILLSTQCRPNNLKVIEYNRVSNKYVRSYKYWSRLLSAFKLLGIG